MKTLRSYISPAVWFVAAIFGVVLALLVFPYLVGTAHSASGVTFIFQNTSTDTQCYVLYWFDHEIKEIGSRPLPLAGGELKPGGVRSTGPNYDPGLYAIGWKKQGSRERMGFEPLRVRSGTSSLVLTPEGLREFLGAAR